MLNLCHSVTFVADLTAISVALVNTLDSQASQRDSRQFEDLSLKKWESYGRLRL